MVWRSRNDPEAIGAIQRRSGGISRRTFRGDPDATPKRSRRRSRSDPEANQRRFTADVPWRSRGDPEAIQRRSRSDPEAIQEAIQRRSEPVAIQRRSRGDPEAIRRRFTADAPWRSRGDPEAIPKRSRGDAEASLLDRLWIAFWTTPTLPQKGFFRSVFWQSSRVITPPDLPLLGRLWIDSGSHWRSFLDRFQIGLGSLPDVVRSL